MHERYKELEEKIARCHRLIDGLVDDLSVERIKQLLDDYEAELRQLDHPDEK